MITSAQSFADHTNVSRETLERLEIYVALLTKWNRKINLVSPATINDVWSRHIQDSAQLAEYFTDDVRKVYDLGSGAGFPGAVLAILMHGAGLEFVLVESDQRKSAFLRTISRDTGVNFSVVTARIEELKPDTADLITARALAPLSKLLEYSRHLCGPDGRCLFLKGASAEEEIQDALETWTFDCKRYQSKTDKKAVVLNIGDIERV